MRPDETFLRIKRRNLVRGAKRRGLIVKLDSHDIQKLLSNPVCFNCGIFCDLEITDGVGRDDAFTFERLNPTIGYVRGNVVCKCWKCNNMKSSEDQLLVGCRSNKYPRIGVYRRAG